MLGVGAHANCDIQFQADIDLLRDILVQLPHGQHAATIGALDTAWTTTLLYEQHVAWYYEDRAQWENTNTQLVHYDIVWYDMICYDMIWFMHATPRKIRSPQIDTLLQTWIQTSQFPAFHIDYSCFNMLETYSFCVHRWSSFSIFGPLFCCPVCMICYDISYMQCSAWYDILYLIYIYMVYDMIHNYLLQYA